MGLFNKLSEPIFLKETSNASEQLETMKKLEKELNPEGQTLLKQDIRALEYGIQGENNIEFELRNSHMPMLVLRDIYLEDSSLSAQIDYLVITRKLCFIIGVRIFTVILRLTATAILSVPWIMAAEKRKKAFTRR